MNAPKCDRGWSKEHGNNRGICCCNCKWQIPINGHPWNRTSLAQTPITQTIGWGCRVPDMPAIVFFEVEHSACEMHEWKTQNEITD